MGLDGTVDRLQSSIIPLDIDDVVDIAINDVLPLSPLPSDPLVGNVATVGVPGLDDPSIFRSLSSTILVVDAAESISAAGSREGIDFNEGNKGGKGGTGTGISGAEDAKVIDLELEAFRFAKDDGRRRLLGGIGGALAICKLIGEGDGRGAT